MVRLTLGTCRPLGAAMSAGHVGAGAAALAVLPAAAGVAVLLVLAWSWWTVWRRDVVRSSPAAIVRLDLDRDRATLWLRGGEIHSCRVLSRFVAPTLVILRLRSPERRRVIPVVIAPDATGADAHRRLRVWLKWTHPGADNPGSL